MTDKLQELKQRQQEWRDITVTQLSNTNNILITLASGLFAFCLGNDNAPAFRIDFSQSIDCSDSCYWSAIFLLGLSIVFGICVLLTRLYDFRISRHIALTRQRFYRQNADNKKKELSYEDLGDFSWTDRGCVLVQILFCKLPFFTSEEIKNNTNQKTFDDKFKKLRTMAHVLGTATWRWTKIQIALFIVSGLLYLVHKTT